MFRKLFLRRAQSLQIVDGKGETGPGGSWGAPSPRAVRSWAGWQKRDPFFRLYGGWGEHCYKMKTW